MQKSILSIVSLLGLSALDQSYAQAAQSAWLNGHEIRQFARQTFKKGIGPTKIECKSGEVDIQNRSNTLFRITYGKVNNMARWQWGWSTTIRQQDIEMQKKGFVKVSADSFRRNSGLRVDCAIWHKYKN